MNSRQTKFVLRLVAFKECRDYSLICKDLSLVEHVRAGGNVDLSDDGFLVEGNGGELDEIFFEIMLDKQN